MYYLIMEAVSVGILTVIVGNIVALMVSAFLKADLPSVCKDWNKYYAMEVSLFLTGVLIHLACEYSGINKWYCRNGVACQ